MQGDRKSEPNETLSIKSQIPKILDRMGSEDSLNFRPPDDVVRLYGGVGSSDHLVKLTVRLFISYSGANPASNVNISVTNPPFLHCLPSNIVLQQVHLFLQEPIVYCVMSCRVVRYTHDHVLVALITYWGIRLLDLAPPPLYYNLHSSRTKAICPPL